jgi:NADH-quinone oxidoreductase subunit L
MCLIVSGVSTLIHLYSISYMTSDRGFNRFFVYLNFFVFSMLLLVLAGQPGSADRRLGLRRLRLVRADQLLVPAHHGDRGGHEGLRDQRDRRRRHGAGGVLHLPRPRHLRPALDLQPGPATFHTNQGVVVAICLLLLVGAIAKSAQVPLHTWLPDAMEGPTPVSALIHAATMVTAGVYLIARFHPLFEIGLTAADIAAIVGLATLLIAATIALVVTDLKKIIAYSTMSQIGYMVVGVGHRGVLEGLFHLMTHAFFKALLFMAAGSIIGAMANRQNIDLMGGFRARCRSPRRRC